MHRMLININVLRPASKLPILAHKISGNFA